MLQIAEIEHEMIETTSGTFIEEWINRLDVDSNPYTDFILIGGDGLFSQMINAIYKHPQKNKLLKIPLGIMPWGSQNAISCDLGGKNPYLAAVKIIRGQTIDADIMKITFDESDNVIYGTSWLWGFPSHVVSQAQNWRWLFGSIRYNVWGFRNYMWNWPFMRYRCNIDYKYDHKIYNLIQNKTELSSSEEESKELLSDSEIKFKKIGINNSLQSLDSCLSESQPSNKQFDSSKWKTLDSDDFFFFVVLTHEARSSITNENFLPFARINDTKMYVCTIERVSKIGSLKFLSKLQKSEHIDMKEFSVREATEVKLSPKSNMFFNIDGEIYPWDGLHIELIPSALKLIGKPYSLTNELQVKKSMLLETTL